MQQYPSDRIRNVVLLSQKGAGKSSVAEALLYVTGGSNRLGNILDGNTASDFQPEEIKHHTSLSLTVLACEWKKSKVNLIDVPGDPEFVGEILSGTRVADAAVLVIDAQSGIEVGTELAWKYAEQADLPVMFILNRMDRENIDLAAVVEELGEAFGPVAALQLPYGSGSNFTGVVDLLGLKGIRFTSGKSELEDRPEGIADDAAALRDGLLDAVVAVDDELTAKYLEDEEITEAEMITALHTGVRERSVFPLLCMSSTENLGAAEVLNAIVDILPSADESLENANGEMAALAFKTIVDPKLGHQTFLKVMSGELVANTTAHNLNKRADERIGHIICPIGRDHVEVPSIAAGDICTVAKLSDTLTGDTLVANKNNGAGLPGIDFPEPNMALAISPKTKSDIDKLGSALHRMTEEDPTLKVVREQATGETLLWGMGDSHVNIALEKIQQKFGAQVDISTPQIPYKETLSRSATANGRFKRQSGGHGQFGDITIILESLGGGTDDIEFKDEIRGGAISKNFVPAVEKGVRGAAEQGVLAGFPTVGFRARLIDGKEHQVDSSDQAFQLAGAMAFREGAANARPTLLEPIHNFEIRVPDTFTGPVIGDLNSRRGRVSGTDQGAAGETVITAEIPLAETQRYSIDLKQITQGRGGFSSEFVRYDEVPQHLHAAVIAEYKKQEE